MPASADATGRVAGPAQSRDTGGVSPTPIHELEFAELFHLEPHGPDTYVAIGALYPWGERLYGGQIVAQALKAAAITVDEARTAHSLHSYFIRAGSPREPVRYEVERLRDGRSFSTRQVVARQSGGAILNLSASFQVAEDEADVQVAQLPDGLVPPTEPSLRDNSWGAMLQRVETDPEHGGLGCWMRLDANIGDSPIDHVCGLAFISDGAPARAARSPHPDFENARRDRRKFQGASLDHSVWFHRPSRPDAWHWFDTKAHALSGGRGLVTADIIREDGTEVGTFSQQVLLRRARPKS